MIEITKIECKLAQCYKAGNYSTSSPVGFFGLEHEKFGACHCRDGNNHSADSDDSALRDHNVSGLGHYCSFSFRGSGVERSLQATAMSMPLSVIKGTRRHMEAGEA